MLKCFGLFEVYLFQTLQILSESLNEILPHLEIFRNIPLEEANPVKIDAYYNAMKFNEFPSRTSRD